MPKLGSYPKVYNIGHRSILELFDNEVLIQEKVDGSQFSFGKVDGEVFFRSKGADVYPENAPNLFSAAVQRILEHQDNLEEGLIYRGEVLHRPKHNVLVYDRVPEGNIVLFDADDGLQNYLPYDELVQLAELLWIEPVQVLYEGKISSVEEVKELLETISQLGGQKVEGIVVKNYQRFTSDGKAMMGKYVSEAFREIHGKDWKERNPGRNDVVAAIIADYRTSARWDKSIQHLNERDELEHSPSDIGKLLKEIATDVHEEEAEAIKDILFKHFWKQISRGINAGFPEYYKERLLNEAFDTDTGKGSSDDEGGEDKEIPGSL